MHIETLTAIPLEHRGKSQSTREQLAAEMYDPERLVEMNYDLLSKLPDHPFKGTMRKVTGGEQVGFDDAYLGMTHALTASNNQLRRIFEADFGLEPTDPQQRLAKALVFMSNMATKSATGTITSQEIAGITAALELDYIVQLNCGRDRPILDMAGIGGDKGFSDGTKVINASTLSSIVLSSVGVPIMKHGGHATTSAMGSADMMELAGVNTHYPNAEAMRRMFGISGFLYMHAHDIKTVHDISHSSLGGFETSNHFSTSMRPPVDRDARFNKVIGTTKVHPLTIARAYEELHDRGYLNTGTIAIVSGLDKEGVSCADYEEFRSSAILDEVSPHRTSVTFLKNGILAVTHTITPGTFGVTVDPEAIRVKQEPDTMMAANMAALSDTDPAMSDYLAMNAAVGLLVNGAMDELDPRRAYDICREAIASGQALHQFEAIRQLSHAA